MSLIYRVDNKEIGLTYVGQTLSDETKSKMRAVKLGTHLKEETRRNLANLYDNSHVKDKLLLSSTC